MMRLSANIVFLYEEEGGMDKDGFSGIRPNFEVAGDLITSEIWSTTEDEIFVRGTHYRVIVHLPYGEVYRESIDPEMKFTLRQGARILGYGEVVEILDIVDQT